MELHDAEFTDQKIILDNNKISGCTFRRCQLIYYGFGNLDMDVNQFYDCTWHFEGPAGNTIQFMSI